MHRRSNLQCNELNKDFSIKNYKFTCDVNNLPQNMRPFANRMCGNYDYTKNGIPTYGANPVKTCNKNYIIITEEEPKVIITEEPNVLTEQFTNGSVRTIYPSFIAYEQPRVNFVQTTYVPVYAYYP